MTSDLTPRRSVLYLPGANERALEKAKTLGADALILDLEDAVAPDAKPAARERVCAAVGTDVYGDKEVTIRVNGLDTPWFSGDMRAAAQVGPAGIVVPKVSGPTDVLVIEAALEKAGAPDRTSLWAMVETPAAMLHCEQIAAASQRLTVLVMGTNDLAKELRAAHVPGRAPLLAGLGLCLLAARATGTVILDGVYNDVRDAEGFAAECRQGVELGFDGKTLIHPSQIGPCNAAWAPSEAAVADALELIAAFDEAVAAGRGVAVHKGRMIENLHVETARRVLALHDAITRLSP